MLAKTTGLERADLLSIRHIELALKSLMNVKRNQDNKSSIFTDVSPQSEEHLKALIGLALKVKTRKQ